MRELQDKRLWIRFGLLWVLSLVMPIATLEPYGGIVFVGMLYLGVFGIIFSGQMLSLWLVLAMLILFCALHALVVLLLAMFLRWLSFGRIHNGPVNRSDSARPVALNAK